MANLHNAKLGADLKASFEENASNQIESVASPIQHSDLHNFLAEQQRVATQEVIYPLVH